MKIGGRSGIVEKNRNKRGAKRSIEKKNVEYSVVGYKLVVIFIIVFEMCAEGKAYNEKV
jgi:hypothetical protein